MRFHFTGVDRTFSFKNLLLSLNLPACVDHLDRTRGWEVKTDSRCLAHAARISPFIYTKGGK